MKFLRAFFCLSCAVTLVACATKKKDAGFEAGEGAGTVANCPDNYQPIQPTRTDGSPEVDPDRLTSGTYSVVDWQFFLSVAGAPEINNHKGGLIQAYFAPQAINDPWAAPFQKCNSWPVSLEAFSDTIDLIEWTSPPRAPAPGFVTYLPGTFTVTLDGTGAFHLTPPSPSNPPAYPPPAQNPPPLPGGLVQTATGDFLKSALPQFSENGQIHLYQVGNNLELRGMYVASHNNNAGESRTYAYWFYETLAPLAN